MDNLTRLALGLGVLIAAVWTLKSALYRRRKKRLVLEARAFTADVKARNSLVVVPTHVLLKRGEVAFYSAPTTLYETRAVRRHEGGSRGIRIAKGIYIGGHKGRSFSVQEWAPIDAGHLVVTNKRLLFDGQRTGRSVTIPNVISAQPSVDRLEVTAGTRQKSMVFSASNPLVVSIIIQICAQADDPTQLSATSWDVTIE